MDILDQNQVNEQQINAQNNTTMTSLPPKTWLVEAILAPYSAVCRLVLQVSYMQRK